MPKKTELKELIKNLGIDETNHIKPQKYKFDTIKENTFPMGGYNYMIDSLSLPSFRGFGHLLVLIDLWSDAIDFEPMRSTKSIDAVKSFKKIIERPIFNLPQQSIRSDNGVEFKAQFHQYLLDNNIIHRKSLPYRHKQNSNTESANRTIGRILQTYLSNKQQEKGRVYKNWIEILPQVRAALNQYRLKPDKDPFNLDAIPWTDNKPIFKLGEYVICKYEEPHDIQKKKETITKWRQGDVTWNIHTKRKIVKILNYPNNIRYIVRGLPNVAYVAEELRKVAPPAEEEEDEV